MNLPNFFIADLPPEATVTSAMISDACQTLKHNRERYLIHRSTQSLIQLLSSLASSWLDPQFPFRKLALEQASATGFSPATLAKGLDYIFRAITPEAFNALVEQDIGSIRRLDEMTSGPTDKNGAAFVWGPELMVHIAAGNVPAPAFISLILGLLVRSSQILKCASGTALLPRLFAHSLYDADPKIGACLEIVEWPGGNASVEDALFAAADCVTAAGTDETLAHIRRRLSAKTKFLGYGFRVSFAYIACEALSSYAGSKIIERAADDVVAWNQLGCLSPHVIYVQVGGTISPESFAERLADVLSLRERSEPRGELPPETAASIASRRAIYEIRAAHAPDTRYWSSKNSTAWTVVYEGDPQFQLSCLNRFIYVKSVPGLTEALQSANSVRGKVSTVGLGAPQHKAQELATELARWGVTRICPIGKMQNPPLTWHHDGRPALGDLVMWTDWERGAG